MALSGISLNAVTNPTVGAAIMFDSPKHICSLIVTATGSPSSIDVSLQGTIDGMHWVDLATSSVGADKVIGSTSYAVMGLRAVLNNWSGGARSTFTASVAARE
ncbi:hypothetical protein ACQR1I_36310 [Bradyrhizobium sp. HKCCYLS2038]